MLPAGGWILLKRDLVDTDRNNRKECLRRQSDLNRLMTSFTQPGEAIRMFLLQHATLHSAKMTGTKAWSFEDWILDDLSPEGLREVPQKCEHSISWLLWHTSRCEDITMNLLIAGRSQILYQDNWLAKMKVSVCDTGNAMNPEELCAFSSTVDIGMLRAYRADVGRRTQEIVRDLKPEELKNKVDPVRVQYVWDQGAVRPAASGIVEYWRKRTWAGLLLMPASRHIIVHWNEALDIKSRI